MQQLEQNSRRNKGLIFLAVGATLLCSPFAGYSEPARYENPPILYASDLLPPELKKGTQHSVDDRITNDGFMNQYRINSKYGVFQANSTAELKERIREVYAIAAIEKVKSSDTFLASVKEGGQDVVHGVKELVTKPVDTVSNAISGVGRMFRRVGDSLFGDSRSDAESGRVKDIIGFSKTKREYAADYGVDVYSSNQVLQEHLDRIAWAGYSGGLGTGLTVGAIGGPILTTTGGTRLMGEVFRTTPPSDLRRKNRETLDKIGVSADVTNLFMSNTRFSPSQQTLFVDALRQLKGVDNVDAFVKLAVHTADEDEAWFRRRQAQMYAAYHLRVAPIARFMPLGEIVVAKTAKNKLVLNAPVDHLVWTREIARIAEGIAGQEKARPEGLAKEIRLDGNATPLAHESLKKLGWKVLEAQAGVLRLE